MVGTFADRAPLSGAQMDALRRLELWASRSEDVSVEPDEDILHEAPASAGASVDGLSAYIAMQAAASSKEGGAAREVFTPTRTAAELEEFALRTERVIREVGQMSNHSSESQALVRIGFLLKKLSLLKVVIGLYCTPSNLVKGNILCR